MWGAGAGGTGQTQNWAFNTNQYANVVNEHDKWAVLAHQWIQMKNSGGGLEQTLQPPAQSFPNAGHINSNGSIAQQQNHNESVDFIGEAPMELDETVTPSLLPSAPPPLLLSQINLQAQHSQLAPITQIAPNPLISFSGLSSSPLQDNRFQQIPPSALIPSAAHMPQQFRPGIIQQPYQSPQPLMATPTPRLLRPSYLTESQPLASSNQPSYQQNKRNRHPKQSPPDVSKSHHSYETIQPSQSHYEYEKGQTDSEIFEGIPRRSLPAWIRDGLEKVEQEKKKLEQREREAELRRGKELEKKEKEKLANSESESEEEVEQKGYEMPKPYIPSISAPDISSSRLPTSNSNAATLPSALSKKRASSPTLDELFEGTTDEEKLEITMSFVRRQLTLLLLEVTTEEMTQVANETLARAKHKVSSTVQVRKTSALASLISGGPLGLASYDSDSGSEDEGPRRGKDVTSEDEGDQFDKDETSESEAELVAEIEKKKLNFELKQDPPEEPTRIPQRRPSSSSITETVEKTEKKEKSPSLRHSSKPSSAASNTSSPIRDHSRRESRSSPGDSHHENSDRRNSLSTASSNAKSKSSQRSKSPDDKRKSDTSRHRSRSLERRHGRRRRSRSKSAERKPTSQKRRRSRSPSKERKSERKRRPRSRSKDNRNRRHSRSRSVSSARRADKKRRSDSESDRSHSSRRKERRSKVRSTSSSSGSSSASSYTKRKQRRQREERDRHHDDRSARNGRKKSDRRSRSTSKSRSDRRRGRRSRSRSKSPKRSSS